MLHENPILVHESPKEVLQEESLVIGVVKDERPLTPTSTSKDKSQELLISFEPVEKESTTIPSNFMVSTMEGTLNFKEYIYTLFAGKRSLRKSMSSEKPNRRRRRKRETLNHYKCQGR